VLPILLPSSIPVGRRRCSAISRPRKVSHVPFALAVPSRSWALPEVKVDDKDPGQCLPATSLGHLGDVCGGVTSTGFGVARESLLGPSGHVDVARAHRFLNRVSQVRFMPRALTYDHFDTTDPCENAKVPWTRKCWATSTTSSSPDHGPNQVVSASRNPASVPSPTQATCPSGLISTADGAATSPSTGSSQVPAYDASTS
jgi:hypothetical protein